MAVPLEIGGFISQNFQSILNHAEATDPCPRYQRICDERHDSVIQIKRGPRRTLYLCLASNLNDTDLTNLSAENQNGINAIRHRLCRAITPFWFLKSDNALLALN